MKSILPILLFILVFPLTVSAQTDYYEIILNQWSEEEIQQLKEVSTASPEPDILFLINLARKYPKRFSEALLPWFLTTYTKPNSSYTKSLSKEMKAMKPIPVLIPNAYLDSLAYSFAVLSGEKKLNGHVKFNERYTPALKRFGFVAENLFYGPDNALIIVMELLIDEGVKDKGHRKNLFDLKSSHIGIAVSSYPGYGNICVMSFGGIKELATAD